MEKLGNSWDTLLDWSRFSDLLQRVEAAYAEEPVFPPRQALFTALRLTPPEEVKAVILGQDPYHGQGQAHGLAFSVPEGVALPPSLRNIFRELAEDVGVTRECGDLTGWARQGVLLLNTVLTVRRDAANSHKDLGWQAFTDHLLGRLGTLPQPMVFVLWGSQAQKQAAVAAASEAPRLILRAPHPSPLSVYRGFYGSKPFSAINDFLLAHGQTPIRWDT